ncbi:hypothetical protein AFLA70_655g000381 [Aspergillus flavus AF70]|nr:hypothetical protein AFLA70_655g000381 [Aspergillus flavus AF70]
MHSRCEAPNILCSNVQCKQISQILTMSYHYSHEDNEIASSIEERIHAMRNYKAALRSRRASEGSRDAEEIHDDEPQTLEESHAVDQQNNEPTRTVEGFRV